MHIDLDGTGDTQCTSSGKHLCKHREINSVTYPAGVDSVVGC